MFKPAIYFNDYVSLAVMLLMIVALVSGQATASGAQTEDFSAMAPIVSIDDRAIIELSGYLGDTALKVSVDIVTDLGHFRGEDE
jgi:hypothetical protein